jgi:hypothetical protein
MSLFSPVVTFVGRLPHGDISSAIPSPENFLRRKIPYNCLMYMVIIENA